MMVHIMALKIRTDIFYEVKQSNHIAVWELYCEEYMEQLRQI